MSLSSLSYTVVLAVASYFLGRRLLRFWRSYREDPRRQCLGRLFFRAETDERVVFLTFDDGPYEPYTSELLAVLREFNVQATFFLIGENVLRFPETLRAILADGHQVGNHSFSHPSMNECGWRRIREEIERTDELLRAAGVQGPIPFRAPFARKGMLLTLYLWLSRRQHVLFDFYPEPGDWRGAASEVVAGSILAQCRSGSVIVLHDGASRAAPRVATSTRLLIEELQKAGYRFLRVEQWPLVQ